MTSCVVSTTDQHRRISPRILDTGDSPTRQDGPSGKASVEREEENTL